MQNRAQVQMPPEYQTFKQAQRVRATAPDAPSLTENRYFSTASLSDGTLTAEPGQLGSGGQSFTDYWYANGSKPLLISLQCRP